MGQAQDRLTSGGRLLTSNEVTKLLHVSIATVTSWRHRGGGPPYVRIGSKLLYPEAELWAWVEAQNQEDSEKA